MYAELFYPFPRFCLNWVHVIHLENDFIHSFNLTRISLALRVAHMQGQPKLMFFNQNPKTVRWMQICLWYEVDIEM